MTRKDYIKIAEVIKDIRARKAHGARIAELFADMLQEDNARFDRSKFIEATGGEDK